MRFVVLGVGSIGQRHARNLQALGHEVLTFDADPSRLVKATAALGIEALPALEAAADRKPDGALRSEERRVGKECRL